MGIQIASYEVAAWPSLAWFAKCSAESSMVKLYHGSQVEIFEDWFCEAVWDAKFEEGNFDQTDIVFGSGGRIRNGKIIFVSSGSTLDRLHWLQNKGHFFVSNSLPCLMKMADAKVAPGYGDYFEDFGRIVEGLKPDKHRLKTSKGSLHLTYFNNLEWNGTSLTQLEKPNADRTFENFDDYFQFLSDKFRMLADNLSDSSRKTTYEFLGTLSSGYDSTTVTALAHKVGCKDAISFLKARGGEEDHGAITAEVLNINLSLFDRTKWQTKNKEELFICADAKGEDRYFVEAESILKNKVLLTGYHGDKVWDKTTKNLSDNLVRGDRSGLSLTEYRLHAGFINCPVPFWGARQIRSINTISKADYMKPWDLNTSYSRPICRRICEEAGIPRDAFGIKKRASSEQAYTSANFLSPDLMQDYLLWLKGNRWSLVMQNGFPLFISLRLDNLISKTITNLPKLAKIAMSKFSKLPILWRLTNNKKLYRLTVIDNLIKPVYLRRYIFPWALERAKSKYPIPESFKNTDQ